MGHSQPVRRESLSELLPVAQPEYQVEVFEKELVWPFNSLDGLDEEDVRATAYEIFFTACRSSAGFGGRNALSFYSSSNHENGNSGDGTKPNGVVMTPTSRIKRALGLKMLKRSMSKRISSPRSHGSYTLPASRQRRLMTSAEIMRQQMKVTEQSDYRLRKTLMRTLVEQIGTRVETIILPLELLRHLKPLEFTDANEYHLFQIRQLKILEAGLLLNPSIALDNSNTFALRLSEIIRGCESKPIDTGKNSDTMRTLCNCVVSLSWRSVNGTPTDVCHWADGFPLNVHIYVALLQSIFHIRDETLVLDEVDELLELIKKTWSILGITRPVHNLCFTWVLFQQYVVTAQLEPDLLCAAHTMLTEVANDAKMPDREAKYVKLLSSVLTSMQGWAEKRLLHYHDYVRKGTIGQVENLLPLALSASKILGEDQKRLLHYHDYVRKRTVGQVENLLPLALSASKILGEDQKRLLHYPDYLRKGTVGQVDNQILWEDQKRLLHYHGYVQKEIVGQVENHLPLALSASKILGEDVTNIEGADKDQGDILVVVSSGDHVDDYIECSVRNAFAKVLENGNMKKIKDEMSEALLQLAKETEDLALKERESFHSMLQKWHPTTVGVAAVALHNRYGTMLKQYLGRVSTLTSETINALHLVGKLEKVLVQMVVEDSIDCEDDGKEIVKEMIPFEVDSIIMNLLKKWVDERLEKQRECLKKAKESETWNPRSKTEPYAQSAMELMKLAKETVEEFVKMPIGVTEDLVQDLAAGLEHIFQDYITSVASCGSKQSYLPQLPPLTRCNRDSKFVKLWKKATPCRVVGEHLMHRIGSHEGNQLQPSTSRGTQRLYIRLNTLHYIFSHLHSLDKVLSLSSRVTPTENRLNNCKSYSDSSSYFGLANLGIESACQHISEVAAYRLIFLDSSTVFYDCLYVGDVANARIQPALGILKQNLTLLSGIVTDRAQAFAMKEVMRACFEAFAMVLLAGGSSRVFYRSDHEMIEEDFESLKKVFCGCGEGLIAQNIVEREAEAMEGVITLMSQCSKQLVEDFGRVSCERSGIGVTGSKQKLPMPPTTGRWNRADPNTILRVLCHRNERAANKFLKRAFQLPKRK